MGTRTVLSIVIMSGICAVALIASVVCMAIAGWVQVGAQEAVSETATRTADSAGTEVQPEDVECHTYDDSPSNLYEELWNESHEGPPEQWSITAWKDSPWWSVYTLFRNGNSDTFTSSMFNQRKGPGFPDGDVYFIGDTDDDGIVDLRSLLCRDQGHSVNYVDRNMDGFFDFMSVGAEDKSTYYILLDQTWTEVANLDSKKGTCTLVIDGSEKSAKFVDGKWVVDQ